MWLNETKYFIFNRLYQSIAQNFIIIYKAMTKACGLEAVPQILCELNQLKHVELEYSSTLHSYKIITKVLDLVKENVRE